MAVAQEKMDAPIIDAAATARSGGFQPPSRTGVDAEQRLEATATATASASELGERQGASRRLHNQNPPQTSPTASALSLTEASR